MQPIKIIFFQIAEVSTVQKLELYKPNLNKSQDVCKLTINWNKQYMCL
jgi:hypothetical protein